MKELLAALTAYALIAIIDIIRILRYTRIAGISKEKQKYLLFHLSSAVVVPFILVILLYTVVKPDIPYIFITCLIGVWMSMTEAVRSLLAVIKEKG